MLNIDRLLTLADARPKCPKCPTCPTSENGKSDSGNLGEIRASPTCPTCPTCPTEKPTLAKSNDGGAERPLPDHAVDDWRCPLGHREFWISDYGLKICSRCHPNPLELRAAWIAGQGGAS